MSKEWIGSVRACGTASFDKSNVSEFRASVQSKLSSRSLTVNLRHVDDQGVAAVAAMLDATEDCAPHSFNEWGVVAAPRTPGREIITASLNRYATDGAWGVSPQIIPNYSLHSMSGLLSVAFKLAGPNLGIGGIEGREADVFLASMALLSSNTLKGVWAVMTGWQPANLDAPNAVCRAVALAIDSSANCDSTLRLSMYGGRGEKFSLESFYSMMASAIPGQECRWTLPGGGTITWQDQIEAPLRMAA